MPKYAGNEKEYMREYYLRNKDKYKAYNAKKRVLHPEVCAAYSKKYKDSNRDKVRAYNKQWARANAGKVTAYARAYQLLKLSRIPKWLSETDKDATTKFYENRPIGCHVDHIVPLKGKIVSGLHVPWNLQYLPALENVKKSNKF